MNREERSCDTCSEPNLCKFVYYSGCRHKFCPPCYESIYKNVVDQNCRICNREGKPIIFYIGTNASELTAFVRSFVDRNPPSQ